VNAPPDIGEANDSAQIWLFGGGGSKERASDVCMVLGVHVSPSRIETATGMDCGETVAAAVHEVISAQVGEPCESWDSDALVSSSGDACCP
jgi:hypothetical protein